MNITSQIISQSGEACDQETDEDEKSGEREKY